MAIPFRRDHPLVTRPIFVTLVLTLFKLQVRFLCHELNIIPHGGDNLKLFDCYREDDVYLSIRRHMGRNHSVCRRVVLLSRDSLFESIHDIALQYILNFLVKFLNQDIKVSLAYFQ